MEAIGAGLGDDVDYAAGGATKFRVRAAGHNLELLDGFETDVHGSALAAHLFAEEAVVVVAAVEADVVEDSTLAVDVDFVAVGALGDADAGGKCEQVFKFATENRRGGDSSFIQSGRGFGLGDFDDRHVGDDDLLRDRGNLD